MTPAEVDRFVRQMSAMEGWFWPAAAYLIAWIDQRQRSAGVTGDFFEIGTYHGRSAALLASLLREGEQLGVCDLFGVEAAPNERPTIVKNADAPPMNGAARGFLPTFVDNLRRFGPAGFDDRLRIFRGSSAALTPDDTGTRCRIVHIDGGHEAADVHADLVVADRALIADGIVVLDDFHNFAWPGVAEGFFKFMHERPGRFAPLAIGFNKGLVCRPAAHAAWRARFIDDADPWICLPRGPFSLKTVAFHDFETYVFHAPSRRSPDVQRTLLTTLHQHKPRLADRLANMLNYHAAP